VGQDIKTLIDEEKNAGYHNIIWDGRDNYGRYVASGIYLCQFQADDFVEVKKLVLIR
jgi:flagellar hook assembly protein FlgD